MDDETVELTNEYIDLREAMLKFRNFDAGDEQLSSLIEKE